MFLSKEDMFQLLNVKAELKIAVTFGMVFTGLIYRFGAGLESRFGAAHHGASWGLFAGAPLSELCKKTNYWGIVYGACAVIIDLFIFIVAVQPW